MSVKTMLTMRSVFRCSPQYVRASSTATISTPPMLLKIRGDMKKAMQAKDTNRLNVLRGLLSQTLNASKTSNPIVSDMQMLTLLKKTVSLSQAASEEFRAAGRSDLAEKEDLQVRILEEYADDVEIMGEEEMLSTVEEVIKAMQSDGNKPNLGDVLKIVFSSEYLGTKSVDRGEVARISKQILSRPS